MENRDELIAAIALGDVEKIRSIKIGSKDHSIVPILDGVWYGSDENGKIYEMGQQEIGLVKNNPRVIKVQSSDEELVKMLLAL